MSGSVLAPVRGMSRLEHPDLGRIFLQNPTLSLSGTPSRPKFAGVVVAVQRRPLWSIKDLLALPHVEHPFPSAEQVVKDLLAPYRGQMDPKLFRTEVVWASVTPNERVNAGGGHNVARIFGTVGAANAVGADIAIATTGFTTKTATDQSIGIITSGVTTNEFSTIGLSRALGTVQNYVAATTLNGTYAVDVVKTFTASGGGTAHGAALFDQLTVAGSILLCEDIFGSDAVMVSSDTVAVTWTWNG